MLSEEDLRFAQAAKALKDALINPINKQAENFLSWAFTTFVNESNLQYAIDQDLDILTLALNHYGLSHSSLTPTFRTVLKIYWDEIEALLTNVSRVHRIISKKPRCATILDTPRGRSYLNRCCESTYARLYSFTWENQP